MERTTVMAWVGEYERAWPASDAAAVRRLFAEDDRVEDFQEWAYRPDRPCTANGG